jgi:hypothetical protein
MNRRVGRPTVPPSEPAIADHDHEWVLADDLPTFEDGNAIFGEECRWAETETVDLGKHGTEDVVCGSECEETRTYGMEMKSVTRRRDGEPDVTYLVESAGLSERVVSAQRDVIENGTVLEADPDRERGHVIVETPSRRVRYEG